MSREDLSRQLDEHIEIKTPVHQAWLKSQLEKQGYFQVAKKQTARRRFDLWSFMNIKKLVPIVGIALFAVLAVVLWQPIMKSFDGKSSRSAHVYAQEMLKLTQQQYNQLSEEMRRKLGESIQEGGLKGVLDEALSAKDLQFFSDALAEKIMREDGKNYMKAVYPDYEDHDAGYAYIPPGMRFSGEYKIFLFKFTDEKNRRTHLALFTKKNILLPPDTIVASTTISVTRFDLRKNMQFTKFSKTVSSEEKTRARVLLEERLQRSEPNIWKEINQASSVNFFESQEGDNYSKMTNEFYKRRERLKSIDEMILVDEPTDMILDRDVEFNPYRHVSYILSYRDKEGVKGWVSMSVDRAFPNNSTDQLEINHLK